MKRLSSTFAWLSVFLKVVWDIFDNNPISIFTSRSCKIIVSITADGILWTRLKPDKNHIKQWSVTAAPIYSVKFEEECVLDTAG